jgi:ubiquinone/menaquinone biosynthesis C-methylase UbiE
VGDGWFKQAFGAHYPLLYGHRDTAEAKRCLELLPRLAPLVSLLVQSGHAVVGLDLSAELLAIARARRNGKGSSGLVRGDMRQLPFADAAFSSVLSLFTAFGYFGSPAANREPVREVARVLVPGGHWYLDYFDEKSLKSVNGKLGRWWSGRKKNLLRANRW